MNITTDNQYRIPFPNDRVEVEIIWDSPASVRGAEKKKATLEDQGYRLENTITRTFTSTLIYVKD